MTTTRTAIDRATALAAAKGIKTKAQTLKGLLAAIRKAPAKPAKPATQARKRWVVGIDKLLDGYNQQPARLRLIDPHAPLLAVVSATVGRDAIGTVGYMPHRYTRQALESVASATRQGGALLVCWGRMEMPRSPYGVGTKPIVPNGSEIMRRREITQAIRLPAGWRWGAGEGGPFVTGPGVNAYYPTGYEIAWAVQNKDWTQIQAQAQAKAQAQAQAKAQITR